jgi:hypothetical protein
MLRLIVGGVFVAVMIVVWFLARAASEMAVKWAFPERL